MIVDLFIPCFVDQVYPETGFNVIKILKKLDIEVFYNPKQTCCGQPSFNSGYWKETKEIASKFLKDFPKTSKLGFFTITEKGLELHIKNKKEIKEILNAKLNITTKLKK